MRAQDGGACQRGVKEEWWGEGSKPFKLALPAIVTFMQPYVQRTLPEAQGSSTHRAGPGAGLCGPASHLAHKPAHLATPAADLSERQGMMTSMTPANSPSTNFHSLPLHSAASKCVGR